MAQEGQKSVPLDQLNPKQLVQVKKNLEEELQVLSQSLNSFKIATNKYDESKQILNSLKRSQPDSQMLIPITSSLYVQGQLENNQNVLIDYGTGYFVQRNTDQAQKFCDRKIELLKENAEKLNNVIAQKANFIDKVSMELQKQVAKFQQQQEQMQQQQQIKQ